MTSLPVEQHGALATRAHAGYAEPGKDWQVYCRCGAWDSGPEWKHLDRAIDEYVGHILDFGVVAGA